MARYFLLVLVALLAIHCSVHAETEVESGLVFSNPTKEAKSAISELRSTDEKLTSELRSTDEKLTSELRSTDELPTSELRSTDEKLTSELRSTDELPTSELRSTDEKLTSELRSTDEKLTSELRSTDEKSTSELRSTDELPTSELRSTNDQSTSELRPTSEVISAVEEEPVKSELIADEMKLPNIINVQRDNDSANEPANKLVNEPVNESANPATDDKPKGRAKGHKKGGKVKGKVLESSPNPDVPVEPDYEDDDDDYDDYEIAKEIDKLTDPNHPYNAPIPAEPYANQEGYYYAGNPLQPPPALAGQSYEEKPPTSVSFITDESNKQFAQPSDQQAANPPTVKPFKGEASFNFDEPTESPANEGPASFDQTGVPAQDNGLPLEADEQLLVPSNGEASLGQPTDLQKVQTQPANGNQQTNQANYQQTSDQQAGYQQSNEQPIANPSINDQASPQPAGQPTIEQPVKPIKAEASYIYDEGENTGLTETPLQDNQEREQTTGVAGGNPETGSIYPVAQNNYPTPQSNYTAASNNYPVAQNNYPTDHLTSQNNYPVAQNKESPFTVTPLNSSPNPAPQNYGPVAQNGESPFTVVPAYPPKPLYPNNSPTSNSDSPFTVTPLNPLPSNSAPQNNYPVVQNNYPAPQTSYPAPQNNYPVAQSNYPVAQNNYQTPLNNYQVPQNNYQTAQNNYPAPQKEFPFTVVPANPSSSTPPSYSVSDFLKPVSYNGTVEFKPPSYPLPPPSYEAPYQPNPVNANYDESPPSPVVSEYYLPTTTTTQPPAVLAPTTANPVNDGNENGSGNPGEATEDPNETPTEPDFIDEAAKLSDKIGYRPPSNDPPVNDEESNDLSNALDEEPHGSDNKPEDDSELVVPSVYHLFKEKTKPVPQQAVSNPPVHVGNTEGNTEANTEQPVKAPVSNGKATVIKNQTTIKNQPIKIMNEPPKVAITKPSASFPSMDLFRRSCAVKINGFAALGICRANCGPKEVGIQVKLRETCTSYQLTCEAPFQLCCVPNLSEIGVCNVDLFRPNEILARVEKSLNLPQSSLIKLSHLQPAFIESIINYRNPAVFAPQVPFKKPLESYPHIARPSIVHHAKKTDGAVGNQLRSLKDEEIREERIYVRQDKVDPLFKTVANEAPKGRLAEEVKIAKVLRRVDNPRPIHHVHHDD